MLCCGFALEPEVAEEVISAMKASAATSAIEEAWLNVPPKSSRRRRQNGKGPDLNARWPRSLVGSERELGHWWQHHSSPRPSNFACESDPFGIILSALVDQERRYSRRGDCSEGGWQIVTTSGFGLCQCEEAAKRLYAAVSSHHSYKQGLLVDQPRLLSLKRFSLTLVNQSYE